MKCQEEKCIEEKTNKCVITLNEICLVADLCKECAEKENNTKQKPKRIYIFKEKK